MDFIRLRSALVAAVMGVSWCAAQAAPTDFNLRAFNLEMTNAAGLTIRGEDIFNNGNPLSGMQYHLPNGTSVTGGYGSSSFTAGAELNVASSDFVGQQYGVGGLQFRRGDATVNTNNLTPSGYASYGLSLATAGVPGTSLGGLSRNDRFSVQAAFDWRPPQAGESLVLALGGSGGFAYNDRLSLRLISDLATGILSISLDKQSRAADGTVTRFTLASVLASQVLADLSDVDYFSLQFDRDLPSANNLNPNVSAKITFLDASLAADGSLVRLATYNFGAIAPFTSSANGFSGPFVFTNWLQSTTPAGTVPEPGSVALVGLGLLLAAGRSIRRIAAAAAA